MHTKNFINAVASPEVNFIVPIIVFLEVGNVLQKTLPQFKNEDLIQFFENHTIVNLDLQLARNMLVIFKDFNLKTSDAIILACAKIAKTNLFTWDERLIKEAKRFVNVQTPTAFMNKKT